MNPRTLPRSLALRSIASRAGVGIIACVPMLLATAIGAGAGGQGNTLMNLVTDNGGPSTRLWQKTIAGGDAAESWQVGEVTVTAAGPVGSTVTVSSTGGAGQAGTADVSLTLPNLKKGGPDAGARATDTYKTSGRSVGAEAQAVGYSATEASQLQSSLSASVAAVSSSTNTEQIVGSACANASGDDNHAFGKACIVQYLMYANGWDWYIGDDISASGNDSNWWWKLTDLKSWDAYGAYNTIVKYSPTSTQFPPNCETQTYSLGYNGVGISSTETICPDRIDPRFFTHGYGTEWSGCDTQSFVEGTPSVDLDHSPPAASSAVSINVHIEWNCI